MQMFAHMQMQKHLQMQGMEQPLPGLVLLSKLTKSADSLGQDTQGLLGLFALPPPAAQHLLGLLALLAPLVSQGLLGIQALLGSQGSFGSHGLLGLQSACAKHVVATQNILA